MKIGCFLVMMNFFALADCMDIHYSKDAGFHKSTIKLMYAKDLECFQKELSHIVVGKNEQYMLRGGLIYTSNQVGTVYSHHSTINTTKKKNQNIYIAPKKAARELPGELERKLFEPTFIPIDSKKIIRIVEPRLMKEFYWNEDKKEYLEGFLYHIMRKSLRTADVFISFDLHGNNALEEAQKNLAFCYTTSLRYIGKHIRGEQKRIAFLPLSERMGLSLQEAAKIALTTIDSYVQQYPREYLSIYLCMYTQNQYAYYNELLTNMKTF